MSVPPTAELGGTGANGLGTPFDDDHPLTGIVHRSTFEVVSENQYRRYGGSLVTRSRMKGNRDEDAKHVGYCVGRRNFTRSTLDYMQLDWSEAIPQRIELNETLHQELSGRIKRYVNLNADYRQADLSGVIFRLGASLAHYANTGVLDCGIIRGGNPVRAQALEVTVNSLPSRETVFIPRMAESLNAPATFSVLCAAVNGEGSLVVSDAFEVNGETNAVRIWEYAGAECAQGAWEALRILLHMYDTSGASAQAALAATKGIHSVVSVVGHTDEGGFIRDVWRRKRFVKPYGGIYVDTIRGFTKFPVVQKGDRVACQAFVDGIALKTAACAALADPLTYIGGRAYPTVVSVGDPTRAGEGNEDCHAEEDNRAIRTEIYGRGGEFCNRYARLLSQLFLGNDSGQEEASRALYSMMGAACADPTPSRHTKGKTLAPFYWVEPTTLFKVCDRTDATRHGYGVLAGVEEQVVLDAYPEATVMAANPIWEAVAYESRSLRTVPAVVHHYYHERDGLAHMIPYQMRPESMALVGGGHVGAPPLEATVEEAMEAGQALSSYAWKHGMCQLPSPAEAMYLGGKIGVRVNVARERADWDFRDNHVTRPSVGIRGGTIEYEAIRPISRGKGGLGDMTRDIRRSRSRAERALSVCMLDTHAAYAANPLALVPLFEEPGAYDAPQYLDGGPADPLTEALGGRDACIRDGVRQQGPARRHIYTDRSLRIRPARAGAAARAGGRGAAAAPDLGEGAPPQPPAAHGAAQPVDVPQEFAPQADRAVGDDGPAPEGAEGAGPLE